MRSSLFAILVCLTLAAPARAQEPRIEIPYTRFTLANGLTVLLHEDRAIPMVSVNVWYHVGSGREVPGRTGFAHLFEHIMFEGSGHVPEGQFDQLLEAAGGNLNGSTNPDRTNYWENIPSNALELALYLESDRMGYLLAAMSPEKVDGQRDIVKNERRQYYENAPYGMAEILLGENLYPEGHPYRWPTIGYMDDLTAATYQDVVDFYQRYYGPDNASLAIAGDIDVEATKALVSKWFSDVPRGRSVPPIDPPAAAIDGEKRVVLEDRVQLPRLYACWLTPASYTPGDAELGVLSSVLAGGKNSRLYRRLVYDLQVAQDVTAFQQSSALGSQFCIVTTARSGHDLVELEALIQEEIDKLQAEGPTEHEVQRAVNQYEAAFLDGLERIGGFGGKADRLNGYLFSTGNPDWFQEDLMRFRALDPSDIRAAATTYLDGNRLILSVVPEGRRDLAATGEVS
ncbi:MAG: M16 family metallopeptidase [Gemmatimonadota bacterium]